MSRIVRSSLWTPPQPGPLSVNWRHPISRLLGACYVFDVSGRSTKGPLVYDLAGKHHGYILDHDVLDYEYRTGYGINLPDGTHRIRPYIPDHSDFNPTVGLSCFGVFCRTPSSVAAGEGLVAQYEGSGVSKRSWSMTVSTARKIDSGVSNDGSYVSSYGALSTGAITDGIWFSAGMKWVPSDKVYNYLNGVQDGQSSSAPATLYNSDLAVRIGNVYDWDNASNSFPGWVKCVFIWFRSLEDWEFALLHHDPYCFLQGSVGYLTLPPVDSSYVELYGDVVSQGAGDNFLVKTVPLNGDVVSRLFLLDVDPTLINFMELTADCVAVPVAGGMLEPFIELFGNVVGQAVADSRPEVTWSLSGDVVASACKIAGDAKVKMTWDVDDTYVHSDAVPYVGAGLKLTYNVGVPNAATYWRVVGIDDEDWETDPAGYLKWSVVMANADGLAVNYYYAPKDAESAGKKDRVMVFGRPTS